MNFEVISQILLVITGASAIWFLSRKEEWKRWGFIVGILGQPFWLYSTIKAEQWGIVALTIFYTYSFGQGIYFYWIKSKKDEREREHPSKHG